MTHVDPLRRRMGGPPWIGPVTPRVQYERYALWVYLAMLGSATFFFGWRAMWMLIAVLAAALTCYTLIAGGYRLIYKKWPRAASPIYALSMGLLMGLSMPLMTSLIHVLTAGALVGIAVHLAGPAHRFRVHPVAVVQVLSLLILPLTLAKPVPSVLAKECVIRGDAMEFAEPVGGPRWIGMSVTPPTEALRRNDPHAVMLLEQQHILQRPPLMAALLRGGVPTQHEEGDQQIILPRLIDVLIGAVPGPVGATGKLLLIIAGLYLMQRRVGHWRMSVAAIIAAFAALLILPLASGNGYLVAATYFDDLGWRTTVSYLSFQLLASPLLLIALVMAPLTMPRTSVGRVVYGGLLGVGIVTIRWFLPCEELSYVPLIVVGLITPLLENMRRSPFVSMGT